MKINYFYYTPVKYILFFLTTVKVTDLVFIQN